VNSLSTPPSSSPPLPYFSPPRNATPPTPFNLERLFSPISFTSSSPPPSPPLSRDTNLENPFFSPLLPPPSCLFQWREKIVSRFFFFPFPLSPSHDKIRKNFSFRSFFFLFFQKYLLSFLQTHDYLSFTSRFATQGGAGVSWGGGGG